MRGGRALPAAALATCVVVAVVMRLQQRPQALPSAVASVAPRVASSIDAGPFAAPLRGPSLSPDAFVPPGAPRMVHGCARHVHRASAIGPVTPKVGWRQKLPGPITAQVTTSPDEATLYVATLEGSLVALAREGGGMKWSVPLGDRVYSAPLVHDDGTVYVGTDAKKLVAVDPKGKVVFRLDLDGEADTSPVFTKDGLVVVAAGSAVYAVRRGGEIAWRFPTKGKVFTSPAVTDDGAIIVGSQDDHVHAIGPNGTLLWSVDLGADVDGAAAIGDDGAIYVGTDKNEVVKLDRQGKLLWRTDVGGFVRGVLSVARNGDVLAGTYGPVPRVVRVSPEGEVRGAYTVRGTGAPEFGIHGAPLEDRSGTLFFGAQDDAAYAVGSDGMLRWRFETGADVDAPLTMLGDGSLLVPSEDGTLTLLLP